MKAIYRKGLDTGITPFLEDGKEYEVESTLDCAEEGIFYLVVDEDEENEGDATPYPASLFENRL